MSSVLRVAAGRDIEVDDAFRIGERFTVGKTRPILIKLHSGWDRRVVLSGARKLSSVEEYRRRLYISPDEPLETRRRNTMTRLSKKEERKGKTAVITRDGVLSIDEVEGRFSEGQCR